GVGLLETRWIGDGDPSALLPLPNADALLLETARAGRWPLAGGKSCGGGSSSVSPVGGVGRWRRLRLQRWEELDAGETEASASLGTTRSSGLPVAGEREELDGAGDGREEGAGRRWRLARGRSWTTLARRSLSWELATGETVAGCVGDRGAGESETRRRAGQGLQGNGNGEWLNGRMGNRELGKGDYRLGIA
ncbi:hypothetical protein ACLOJK_002582, partial [Asimina triloba]